MELVKMGKGLTDNHYFTSLYEALDFLSRKVEELGDDEEYAIGRDGECLYIYKKEKQ